MIGLLDARPLVEFANRSCIRCGDDLPGKSRRDKETCDECRHLGKVEAVREWARTTPPEQRGPRDPERRRANGKRWKEKNRDAVLLEASERHLMDAYGMSQENYDTILEAQGGVCAICGGVNPSGRKLSVDHDHETLDVRGLLCVGCNTSMGFVDRHREAIIRYLGERWLLG